SFRDDLDGWTNHEPTLNRWTEMPIGGIEWVPGPFIPGQGGLNHVDWNVGEPEFVLNKLTQVEIGDSFDIEINSVTKGWLSRYPIKVLILSDTDNYLLDENEWVKQADNPNATTTIGDYTIGFSSCYVDGSTNITVEQGEFGTGIE